MLVLVIVLERVPLERSITSRSTSTSTITRPVSKLLARYFLYAVIALTAFIATSGTIHSLLPPMVPKGVAAKLEFFTQHKDEFDTLFVGTSHFYYTISPQIFDQTTRSGGLETHSFNFGVNGMHPPENFYILEQILKTKPQKLKWVFLEMAEIERKTKEDLLGTQRILYWHDWPRTSLTLRKTLDPRDNLKWYDNISRIWTSRRVLALHLGLFLKRFTNGGRAADLLPASQDDREATAKLELGPAGDGYRTAGSAMSPERAITFQNALALELSTAGPRTVDRYTEMAFRDAAAKLRQAGALPVFVATPVIFQSSLQFRSSPPPGPILAFNDAKTYPAFFDPSVRIDDDHLTREGAEAFTRLLAREFVRVAHQP